MKLATTLFVLALAVVAPAAAPFAGEAGLQLYSLREEFKGGVPGTLDRVKGYRIKEVEMSQLYGLSAEDFREELDSRGLRAVSGHAQYNLLQKDLPGVIHTAKILGQQYVICPWIPHDEANFTPEAVKAAAKDFNAWGEAMKKEGLSFGYHCHGYEFVPHEGGTLFDLLMQETKPELVTFEMDVFWVVQPGQDPVKLLQKYASRCQLMHLKDLRKGAQTGTYTGHAPKTDDVPLGTGTVNWPAVLAAAAQAGVKHYFIEDESPTAAEAIPQSLKYLETLKR